MAFLRIAVLLSTDVFAWFSMWTMTTYLTDVWKLSVTNATGIVNIWVGTSFILQPVFRYLVDTLFGHFKMLVFSSLAYSIGLAFLFMSTPPVLANSTDTCGGYKPECVGHTQKILFYTALPLIAVGMAGHFTSVIPFAIEQNQGQGEVKMSKSQAIGGFLGFIVMVTGAFALPFIKPWSIRLGIPALLTLIATVIFLSSSCSYRIVGPQGSPLTGIFRVIIATCLKITWKLPDDSGGLYEEDDPELVYLPHTSGLSCFDKAAIIPTNRQEHGISRWRLCRVTEVEETKVAIRVLPMLTTFVVCGVISSLGNSYFQEQANHMNRKVGKLKVPLQALQFVYEVSKENIFDDAYENIVKYVNRSRFKRHKAALCIGFAMVCSVLCCVTAAKVEVRRLGVVTSHGLLDKPEDRIPMSMFWLVPQYMLLAGLDSLMMKGIEAMFSSTKISVAWTFYIIHFGFGIYGLGYLGSVLSVFVVGRISERRGNNVNWFQYTLNRSRLDNYYWTLAAMGAVNLFIFTLVSVICPYTKSSSSPEDAVEEQESNDYYEDVTGCFCYTRKITVDRRPPNQYYEDFTQCCCFHWSNYSGVTVTSGDF